MKVRHLVSAFIVVVWIGVVVTSLSGQERSEDARRDGRRLFERETFGGNGRTCLTCHSRKTGTVSPRTRTHAFWPILWIRYSSMMAATTGTATA